MRLLMLAAVFLHIAVGMAQPPAVRKTPAATPAIQATAPIRCVDVIDGDTLELNDGTKVRLIGIDTPETLDPRKPVQVFGKESSAFAKKLAENKDLRLEYDQE